MVFKSLTRGESWERKRPLAERPQFVCMYNFFVHRIWCPSYLVEQYLVQQYLVEQYLVSTIFGHFEIFGDLHFLNIIKICTFL